MSFVFQDLEIIKSRALWRSQPQSFPRRRLLVWLTYWSDARNFGENAGMWRLTSAMLHAIAAVLLAFVSIPAALLFFVHPLTTMGHSYVAGRCGLLSGLFQIAAGILAIHGHWLVALAIALVAWRWVKEDSLTFFPMIVVLSWKH